jgi:hypothetical protein
MLALLLLLNFEYFQIKIYIHQQPKFFSIISIQIGIRFILILSKLIFY